MRVVLKNAGEVCKVWAEQSQSIGSAGNVNFEGPTIFSYGWWPMATFIADKVVLYRHDSYSVTTSSHQSAVRHYIIDCTVFNVIDLNLDHVTNVAHYRCLMRQHADDFWRGRCRCKSRLRSYFRVAKEARAYVKYFDREDLLPPLFGLELAGQKAQVVLRKQNIA